VFQDLRGQNPVQRVGTDRERGTVEQDCSVGELVATSRDIDWDVQSCPRKEATVWLGPTAEIQQASFNVGSETKKFVPQKATRMIERILWVIMDPYKAISDCLPTRTSS